MRNLIGVSCIVLAILSSGCQLTPNFKTGYQVDQMKLSAGAPKDALAVRRFEDNRAPRVYTSAGKLFLTYVPLIPYVSFPFERIDESVRIQSENIRVGGRGITLAAKQNVAPDYEEYTYPASIAKAISDDLAASGLFKEVAYVGNGTAQGQRYLLNGSVKKSTFQRSATSYMLGMPGVLLWFLPIPMAKITGTIDVDLTLTDTQSNQVVWQKNLTSKVTRLITLYTSSAMVYGQAGAFSMNVEPPPADAKVDHRSLFGWHFEALRRAVAEAKPELAQALAGK